MRFLHSSKIGTKFWKFLFNLRQMVFRWKIAIIAATTLWLCLICWSFWCAGTEDEIEIIQQNPGTYASSRETFKLKKSNGLWKIKSDKALGWLRKK